MKVKKILACSECPMPDVVWTTYFFFRNATLNETTVFGGPSKNVDEWTFVDVFLKIHYSLQKSKQFVFIYTDCTESRSYLITRNNLIQINLLVKKNNYIHAVGDGIRRNSDVMGES